jgi:hypothetical protein
VGASGCGRTGVKGAMWEREGAEPVAKIPGACCSS